MVTSRLKKGIGPLPKRMMKLPLADNGYPVPWFVHWDDDGRPVFQIIGKNKMREAMRRKLCWVCGEPLGRWGAFVVGPMCGVNRISGEPPCHRDCAIFSATTCPFLIMPHMKRNDKAHEHIKIKTFSQSGIARNPGVALVWITDKWAPIKGRGGEVLFTFEDPQSVFFYREGREATEEEVVHSIVTGLPFLSREALQNGAPAIKEMGEGIGNMNALLDRYFGRSDRPRIECRV